MSADSRPGAESLRSLLCPRSVAVVGASDSVFTFSGAPLHNLLAHGFEGAIYPVNPRRQQVGGMRCYDSVMSIPQRVDTAVVTVPAHAVVEVLRECNKAGIPSATVVSAGFGEDGAGEAGQALARELEEFLASSEMRVIGPNTAGLMNLHDNYVPRAAANHIDGSELRAGSVALITQSGACSNIIFNRAQAAGVGVGMMMATGGESDVTVWDLVEHVLDDDRITVIMVVIEALASAARIRQVAEQARRLRKPLIVLKLGSTPLGSEVVLTHSGSIAGDWKVAQTAFHQWGIVTVDDFDALWETARLFEGWGADPSPTGRLGVFAFSGGEAALIADHASTTSLELPPVNRNFEEGIRSELAFAKAANPFDATGELVGRPEKLLPVLTKFLDENNFTECLIATPVYRAEAAERILPQLGALFDERRGSGGPRVVFSMWPAGPFTERQGQLLAACGEPVLMTSTRTIAAIDRYVAYIRAAQSGTGHAEDPASGAVPPQAPRQERRSTYAEVRAVLQGLGLPFAPAALAHDMAEAVAAASRVGYPVVMKGNVASTVHKAKAGLIHLGLNDSADVSQAFQAIQTPLANAAGNGVVLEKQTSASLQCFIGARRDPEFGVTLIFGLGGSAAEFLEDTALLVADTSGSDIRGLVGRTRVGSFLLKEFPDLGDTLVGALSTINKWMKADPSVTDIDINPVMVDTTSGRVTCVDARVVVTDPTQTITKDS